MGAWGTGLYSDDVAADIRGDYVSRGRFYWHRWMQQIEPLTGVNRWILMARVCQENRPVGTGDILAWVLGWD